MTELLKELREGRNLLQKEIAELLHTSQQYYSKYEKGHKELPLHHAVMLANFYGVSLDYLTGRTHCREGVDGLNRRVTNEYTTGDLVSDVLYLKEGARRAVVDYVSMQKERESKRRKEKPV